MNVSDILLLLSGICWSLVYIEIIRLGFKHKTYGMPLFALALNVGWEFIYSFIGYSPGSMQRIVNIVWFSLDLVIVITFFKYGFQFFPKGFNKKLFFAWGIVIFAVSFVLQMLFHFQFPENGESFAAFLQNLLMSFLFIHMLVTRTTTAGQSMTIGISKCVGTLAPTIVFLLKALHSGSTNFSSWYWFIFALGAFCFVFDILYIVILAKRKKHASSNI